MRTGVSRLDISTAVNQCCAHFLVCVPTCIAWSSAAQGQKLVLIVDSVRFSCKSKKRALSLSSCLRAVITCVSIKTCKVGVIWVSICVSIEGLQSRCQVQEVQPFSFYTRIACWLTCVQLAECNRTEAPNSRPLLKVNPEDCDVPAIQRGWAFTQNSTRNPHSRQVRTSFFQYPCLKIATHDLQ